MPSEPHSAAAAKHNEHERTNEAGGDRVDLAVAVAERRKQVAKDAGRPAPPRAVALISFR
jgi:hypothetical protein